MNRKARYLTVPVELWEHQDLSLQEKAVLIEIDSYGGSTGYDKPVGRLSEALGITRKTVSEILATLRSKGALKAEIAENGDTVYLPVLGKRRYLAEVPVEAVEEQRKEQDNIDYAAILAAWKDACPGLRQPRVFTPRLQQKLRNLLRNNRCTVEDFVRSFKAVACSSFLNGRNAGKGGKPWAASLEWLASDTNGCYQRLITGGYHSGREEREALELVFSAPVENGGVEARYR